MKQLITPAGVLIMHKNKQPFYGTYKPLKSTWETGMEFHCIIASIISFFFIIIKDN